MTTAEYTQLHNSISRFQNEYAPSLQLLASLLNEAGISHYSSACGVKRITYDIFPAAGQVQDLIAMVSLERNHRSNHKVKADMGLRDASANSTYNPAVHFIQYMRRWSGYAEQVMQYEGASPRGVAAARAKLLMKELEAQLGPQTAPKMTKISAKVGALPSRLDFPMLMQSIGVSLESHKKQNNEHTVASARERMQQNYARALEAANNDSNVNYAAAG